MRKFDLKNGIFISLLLLILVIPVISEDIRPDNLNKYGDFPQSSIVVDKIIIDGNNIFTNWDSCPHVKGAGTKLDPYVLEDLVIDAGNVGHAISISNSDNFFIIRNCTLSNSGSEFGDAGIKLSNVQNGLIINNSVFNCQNGISTSQNCMNTQIISNHIYNSYMGYYLLESHTFFAENQLNDNNYGVWCQIDTGNNTIKNNIISGSDNTGIMLCSMTYPNIISHNEVFENYNGIQCYSETANQLIIENNCHDNTNGIRISNSQNNNITQNTCNSNSYGIKLDNSNYNNITENDCSQNTNGIYCDSSSYNTIDKNYVWDCSTPLYDNSPNNYWGTNYQIKPIPNTPSFVSIAKKYYTEVPLNWTSEKFSEIYYLYRYNSEIVEINSSVELIYSGINPYFTDINHGNDQTYFYTVIAGNSEGNSSLAVNVHIYINRFLPQPTFLEGSYSIETLGMVYLNWTNSDPFIDSFSLYRNIHPFTELDENSQLIYSGVENFYQDFRPTEGMWYYAVETLNETGSSVLSNCVEIFCDYPSPNPPQMNDPIFCYSEGTVNVSWVEQSDAINYTVFRSKENITSIDFGCTELTTTEENYYLDFIEEDGYYFYGVVARNETGISDLSNIISVFVDVPDPESPLLNLTYNITSRFVHLSWNHVLRASRYYVFRCKSNPLEIGEPNTLIGIVSESNYTEWMGIEGIYYYAIIAGNAFDNSSLSNIEYVSISQVQVSPISILSNEQFLSEDYPWILGNGTPSNPYRIENLEIDAKGLSSGIEIRNTNEYFIIRNCIISNAPDIWRVGGIAIENTQNGVIRNNTLFNCENGINTYGNCFNSFIYSNHISNNYMGIHLLGSEIYINENYIENNFYGIWCQIGAGNNKIEENWIVNSDSSGIVISSMTDTNYVLKNTIYDCWTGINLFSETSNQIVIGNDCRRNYAGIRIDDSNSNNISKNICIDNTYGIWASGTSSANHIEQNIVVSCSTPISDESGTNIWIDNYNTWAKPEIPVINSFPSVSFKHLFTLSWSDDPFVQNYYVYLSESPISEINENTILVYSGRDNHCSVHIDFQGIYYFVVVAENPSGTTWSELVSIYFNFFLPDCPDFNENEIETTSSKYQVNWSPVIGAVNYSLYQSTEPILEINDNCELVVITNGTSHTGELLINNDYYFAVVAINGTGSSRPSENCIVHIRIPPPETPYLQGNIRYNKLGLVSLNWTESKYADYYEIYRSSVPINGDISIAEKIGETTELHYEDAYSLTDISFVVYFYVTAVNLSASSAPSNELEIDIDFPDPIPPTLSILYPLSIFGEITFSWEMDATADYYLIYRATSVISSINSDCELISNTTANQFTDHLKADGIYYYAIIAVNASGISPISNSIQIIADFPGPRTPSLFEPMYNVNTSTIVLECSEIEEATEYLFYRLNRPITEINDSVTFLGSSEVPYWADYNNKTGVWYYVVVASNVNGTSSPSNFVSVKVEGASQNPFDSFNIPGYNGITWIIFPTVMGIFFSRKKRIFVKNFN